MRKVQITGKKLKLRELKCYPKSHSQCTVPRDWNPHLLAPSLLFPLLPPGPPSGHFPSRGPIAKIMLEELSTVNRDAGCLR